MLGSVGAVSVTSVLTVQKAAADSQHNLPRADKPVIATEFAFEGTIEVGAQQRSADNPQRCSAVVTGGEFAGPLLQGSIQAGQVDWLLDATNSMVEITARYAVLRDDGLLVQVTDRCVHAQSTHPSQVRGLRSAPTLHTGGAAIDLEHGVLVAMLDASNFAAGRVTLRAVRIV